MGLFSWLKKLFGSGRSKPSSQMVPFLDPVNSKVIQIPVSELRPGAVQVRLVETGEIVWALAAQLQQGELRHPPFDEPTRDYIRKIQAVFAEHHALSFEEWEDGFRRDDKPEKEIALWTHAGDIYTQFTSNESAPHRRREIFRTIMACMTTGPDSVWKVLRPQDLTREEAQQIVDRFYGKKS
jgi:hypothetical protein